MNRKDAEAAAVQKPIESRADFEAAIGDLIGLALARRVRRMVWVDTDFAEWPLDDPALLTPLTQWLQLPGRQLLLLATNYEDLRRQRARFVSWYRLWSHAVSACSPAPDDVAELPCVLLADGAGLVHLSDPLRWRGWAASGADQQRQWRDRLDAYLQRSESALPATTLGL